MYMYVRVSVKVRGNERERERESYHWKGGDNPMHYLALFLHWYDDDLQCHLHVYSFSPHAAQLALIMWKSLRLRNTLYYRK